MAKRDTLDVGGRKIQVSNLEKVLYPANHFTKAQVIDYYIRVAEYLLPHFRNRPVTLKRYPDGVRGEFFYEKDAPHFAPDWIHTFPVPRRAGGTDIRYILINDLPTLTWCANIASLELHPFLHRAPNLDQPDFVVFDLDPGPGTDILTCAKVAFLLRELLAGLNLQCWPKVSGSKGLQIYVPLNTPVSYSATQPFARAVAQLLAKQHPALIVAEMAKSERSHKIFIDWSQNSDFKTTAGVYSLRAKRDRPFVSLPVSWDELTEARKAKSADDLYWEPEAALERLKSVGDLFAPVLTVQQTLPDSIGEGPPKKSASHPSKAPHPSPRASAQGRRRRFAVQKRAASGLRFFALRACCGSPG